MRILYFAPHEPWPLTSGARLRDYHLARQLAKNAAVTFLGVRNANDPEPDAPPASCGFEQVLTLPKGRSYTPQILMRGLVGPNPITVLNYSSGRIASGLAEILSQRRFDTVQIESVQLGGFYLKQLRTLATAPVIISDWHNLESEIMRRYADQSVGPRRWVASRTATLLERAEGALLDGCDACIMASDREREKARTLWPGSRQDVHVIPNGVDCEHYSVEQMGQARGAAPSGPPFALFVGSMDYHANIDGVLWFAREVWPSLRRQRPTLKFIVVGRNPPIEVRKLAGDGIEVTGTVQDVRPYYAGAAMVVVPLRVGSGTRLKILEAMASGVPVVSTRLGAEGLSVTDSKDIVFADCPEEIVSAVKHLISNQEFRVLLTTNAADLVRRRYDWSILGDKLRKVHEEALDRSRTLQSHRA